MNRAGESEIKSVRSDRFYKEGAYWYYKTRELVEIGPFDTKDEAAQGVNDFVEFIKAAEPKVIDTFEKCAKTAA